MANIDISSLFSDVLPDPARQQQERVLQQNDAVNQANLVGTLGGMAAYYGPERSRALQQSATGLLGIDTRTESQKAIEQLKDAKIDMSTPKGLIEAANIYQSIDPIKASEFRAAAADLTTKMSEDEQKAAESQSLVAGREENILSSQATRLEQERVRVEKAAQETLENANAGLTINSAATIMRKVSPELADQFTTLFPATKEGADAAKEFALESIKTPDRDFTVETVLNDSGIPERVIFDKNDENYRRVLGTDDSVLSGNAGKKFGKLKQPAGTSIDVDSFNYRANAKKALGIAFNPFLESIVGPTDITRAMPNLLVVEPQQQLRREITNSKTYGILPIVRLIAPVTEVDVKLLQDVQLGFEDPQEVWIQRSVEEILPLAINAMYRGVAEEGTSASVVHQFALASAAEVFTQIAEHPEYFGDYSLKDASDAAYELLPSASSIDMREIPTNVLLFKGRDGKAYDTEVLASLRKASGRSIEQQVELLGLEEMKRDEK